MTALTSHIKKYFYELTLDAFSQLHYHRKKILIYMSSLSYSTDHRMQQTAWNNLQAEDV